MEKVSEKAEGKKETEKNKETKAEKKTKSGTTIKEKPKSRLAKIKRIVKKEEKKEIRPLTILETDPFKVLKFVLMTEKAIRMIELQNKLVFIVERKSTKKDIKAAAETAFQTPVEYVNTTIDQKGRKKAFIKFKEAGQAGEIAIRLGII